MQSFTRPDRALVEAFRNAPTAVVSDNLDRLAGLTGLRPFHRRGHLLGPARTVRTRPGDNLFIHKMLDVVEPGDVPVAGKARRVTEMKNCRADGWVWKWPATTRRTWCCWT